MNAAQLEAVIRAIEMHVKQLDKELTEARRVSDRLQDQLRTTQSQLDKTQQKLDDHITHVEKWDARRWATIGFFIAGLVTLVANLVLILVRK
jgi:septal ring factor EnvC (AmiA/AmiB activator)